MDKSTSEAIAKASRLLESAGSASLQKIVAASADGMVIVDGEGVIRFTNPSANQLFGYSVSEMTGQPFGFPVVAGDTAEIDIVRKDGGTCVAEMRVVMVDWDGHPAFLASLRDITARKRTEYELEQYRIHLEQLVEDRTKELNQQILERTRAEEAAFKEKEGLRVTLDSIAESVIATDEQGNIQNVNPAAAALLGKSESALLGQPIYDVLRFIDENTRQPVLNPVEECLRTGKVCIIGAKALLIGGSGREYSIQDSAAPIRDPEGRIIGSVLVFRDITKERQSEKAIVHQASHDALTDLINRREFEKRLHHAVEGYRKHGTQHTLCYLDLDQFKVVNDTAGHLAGDDLLRQVAGLLAHAVRERDTVSRLGGDEFALLLDNCLVSKAEQIADNIIASVRDFRFEWEGHTFQIGVSIGIAPITDEIENSIQLMARADMACYAAKEEGRNRFHVYMDAGDQ